MANERYVADMVGKRVEKVLQMLEKLPNLKDPHCEFAILRSCLALPKVVYLHAENQHSHRPVIVALAEV